MTDRWYDKLRGGRCHRCDVAWAWKRSAAAPLTGAHCPQCGAGLYQTTLQNIKRFPIRAGFPWYRATTGPRGLQSQFENLTIGRSIDTKGYWHTFDSTPGNDTAQAGKRIVRRWAPTDTSAPDWLNPC